MYSILPEQCYIRNIESHQPRRTVTKAHGQTKSRGSVTVPRCVRAERPPSVIVLKVKVFTVKYTARDWLRIHCLNQQHNYKHYS